MWYHQSIRNFFLTNANLLQTANIGQLSYISGCSQVEVEFADGSSFHLSAEFLRVYSPAADSKIRSIAGEKVIFGRRHVGIMSAESIGNYGVRILFDDLHKTGIFTWDFLYHLGSNKFSLMRNYIKMLRRHGLTRDPQRRKWRNQRICTS